MITEDQRIRANTVLFLDQVLRVQQSEELTPEEHVARVASINEDDLNYDSVQLIEPLYQKVLELTRDHLLAQGIIPDQAQITLCLFLTYTVAQLLLEYPEYQIAGALRSRMLEVIPNFTEPEYVEEVVENQLAMHQQQLVLLGQIEAEVAQAMAQYEIDELLAQGGKLN